MGALNWAPHIGCLLSFVAGERVAPLILMHANGARISIQWPSEGDFRGDFDVSFLQDRGYHFSFVFEPTEFRLFSKGTQFRLFSN